MKKVTKEQIRKLVEQEVKKKSDVKRIAKKIDSLSGQLEPLFDTITDVVEFEQFLKDSIRLGSKNLKGSEILLALSRVAKQLRSEIK